MRGFTLIELVVVIAIIGILVVAAVPSYNDYSKNQKLAEAANQLQAILRQAQNNAQTGTRCKTSGGLIKATSWQVELATTSEANESYDLLPVCETSTQTTQNIPLPDGVIVTDLSIGDATDRCSTENAIVRFNNITSKISFISDCIDGANFDIKVTLGLSGSSNTRTIAIKKGGSIYVDSTIQIGDEITVPTSSITLSPSPTSSPTVSPTLSPTSTPGPSGNLALNKLIATLTDENGINVGANAVDGNTTTTRWSSVYNSNPDPQWIYVDLGASYGISQVILRWETAYGKDYLIQTSNNATNWTTIYTQVNGDGGVDTINASGNGRYVRMYGTARGTQYGYSLYEFEVYGY